ncbi:MAG: AtpZ/AtpI family protein [Pseudomonadota bacterium]
MSQSQPPNDPLKDLGDRLDAARDARKPKPIRRNTKLDAVNYGWRMTIDLVVGVGVGMAMGWGLDSLFGTLPAFLIVMTLVGFGAGVRVMLKSAEEFQKEQAEPKGEAD